MVAVMVDLPGSAQVDVTRQPESVFSSRMFFGSQVHVENSPDQLPVK